jgi:hypothetical protein
LGKRRRWVGCESSRVPAAACHANDPPIVVSGYLRSARLAISPGCRCFNTLRPGRTYALVFLIEPISPAKCRRPNPFILINPRRVAKWPAAAPCRMDTPILDGPLKCLALAFGPLKRSRLRSIPRRSMGSNLLAIGAPGFGRVARQIGPNSLMATTVICGKLGVTHLSNDPRWYWQPLRRRLPSRGVLVCRSCFRSLRQVADTSQPRFEGNHPNPCLASCRTSPRWLRATG